MLQSTVIGKSPFCPKMENSTITPFTNRYGAIFLRNRTTCGFSQRRSSSADAECRRATCADRRSGTASTDTARSATCRSSARTRSRSRTRDRRCPSPAPARNRRRDPKRAPVGIEVRGWAVGAEARGAGASRASSAVTSADALGNRFAGSFSSSIMIDRARSVGTSLRRCSTGIGRSEMCFTSIAGVLPADERRLAGQHLVAQDAERVEVAAPVDLPLARCLLRRHVRRRADRHAGGRETAVSLAVHGARDTEVGHHRPAGAASSRMLSGLMSRWTTPRSCA